MIIKLINLINLKDKMKLGLYRHYKGNYYLVKAIATHTENAEKVVVYQSLYGDFGNWVRPQTMFTETVDYQGQLVDRFTFISNPNENPPTFN